MSWHFSISPASKDIKSLLSRHFAPTSPQQLVTASRTFPITCRVDLHLALEGVFGDSYPTQPLGLHDQFPMPRKLTFADLGPDSQYPISIGPLQYDEIDIGEAMPARCLQTGLWLAHAGKMPFAVLISPAMGRLYGEPEGTHLQIAVPPGEAGMALSRVFFAEVERLVKQAGSFRGKVLSLEANNSHTGTASAVKVHKLRDVQREEVILPVKTLALLERNVHGFIAQREGLRQLGLPVKKGLLFYGPPGTGKTHTIHYLAALLKDHTTLLITAEQVGLLDTYFQLARFLQPVMIVIEDADLIARERNEMRGPCEESLLNRLLNEMDGLREDAEVMFVLTTNRPEQLEPALASRPGRIDQAIEFPLPDDDGRHKLLHLYAREQTVPNDVAQVIVRKTKGASAAFIKELMRRAAQFRLEAAAGGTLDASHIEAALEEMVFSGGSLNVKLLGGIVTAEEALTP